MNEQLLAKLYEKYGMSKVGTYDQFKADMADPAIQKKVFEKYGLQRTGTFEDFQRDLGYSASPVEQPIDPQTDVPDRTFGEAVKDVGIGLAEGVIDTKKAVQGVYGMMTLGALPKAQDWVEKKVFGGTAEDAREWLREKRSDKLKALDVKKETAEGFTETVKTYLQNPSLITQDVAQAAPAMVGGAGLGRLAAKGASSLAPTIAKYAATTAGKIAAGATGEGIIAAGMTAEDIRSQTDDQLLTVKQSSLSALSGILTGALGVLGGKVAKKLKVTDLDTLMQGLDTGGKVATTATARQRAVSVLASAIGGVIAEGPLEELPQSAQEMILQNIALGKDPLTGVPEAMATGLVVGSAMGGTVSGLTKAAAETKAGIVQKLNKIIDEAASTDTEVDGQIDAIAEDARPDKDIIQEYQAITSKEGITNDDLSRLEVLENEIEKRGLTPIIGEPVVDDSVLEQIEKITENAIQEQSTEEVSAQPEVGVSPGVGGQISEAQVATGTQEEAPVTVEDVAGQATTTPVAGFTQPTMTTPAEFTTAEPAKPVRANDDLREQGYSEEQIAKLTPGNAVDLAEQGKGTIKVKDKILDLETGDFVEPKQKPVKQATPARAKRRGVTKPVTKQKAETKVEPKKTEKPVTKPKAKKPAPSSQKVTKIVTEPVSQKETKVRTEPVKRPTVTTKTVQYPGKKEGIMKYTSNESVSDIAFKEAGPKEVVLENIQTPETNDNRKKGSADRLLSTFLRDMDNKGKRVTLTVAPRDKTTDPKRLEAWYYRHGFRATEFGGVELRDPITGVAVEMTRPPKKKPKIDAVIEATKNLEKTLDKERKKKGRLKSSLLFGMEADIAYYGVRAARVALEAGKTMAQALEAGIEAINKRLAGKQITDEQRKKFVNFLIEKTATDIDPETKKLVKELADSDQLLGATEETKAEQKAVMAEQIADFLREKADPVELQSYPEQKIDDFIEAWNQLSPFRQISKSTSQAIKGLLIPKKPVSSLKQQSVTVSIAEIIKEITNNYLKGKKKGFTNARASINQQLGKIKEALKKANLKPHQVGAIIGKLQKTNPFSPGAFSELSRYIDKVVTDTQYADSLRKARTYAKVLKRQVSRKKGTELDRVVIKEFLLLDPTNTDVFPSVESYNEVAQSIMNAFKPVTKGFEAMNHKYVHDYVKGKLINQIKSLDPEYFKNNPDVGTNTELASIYDNIKMEQINKAKQEQGDKNLTDDTDIDEESLKPSQIEVLRLMAYNAKKALQAVSLPDEHPDKQKALKELQTIDLSLLTANQLKFYIQGADRITTNGDFGGTGILATYSKAQKDFKTLYNKLAGKTNILKVFLNEDMFSSMPLLMEGIFGMSKQAALFQLYMGIKGLSDAHVSSIKTMMELNDALQVLHDKKPGSFTDEAKVRRSVYLHLMEYEAGEDPSEALAQNKMRIEQDLVSLDQSYAERHLREHLQKAYDAFKGATTMEQVQEIMARVDKDGQQVAKVITDFFEKRYEDSSVFNELYFNTIPKKIINYGGQKRYRKIGVTEDPSAEAEPVLNRIPELNLVSKPKQADTSKERKKGAKIKYDEATDTYTPLGEVLNYNADLVALNQAQKDEFTEKSTPSRLQVNFLSAKKSPFFTQLLEILGRREEDKKSYDRSTKLYNKIFHPTSGIYYHAEKNSLGSVENSGVKVLDDVLNFARRLGYSMTLSGVTQGIKQQIVLANAMTQLGTDAPLIVSSVTDLAKTLVPTEAGKQHAADLKAFFKNVGVSIREVEQSIFSISGGFDLQTSEKLEKLMRTTQFSGAAQAMKAYKDWIAGLKPLLKSDAAAAKTTYMAFYKQFLSDHGYKFRGWGQEAEASELPSRKEAHAYAKQRTDILQTVSNPNEQGKLVSAKGTFEKLFKAGFMPYGTFSSNQRTRLWVDLKKIFAGNAQQKKEGAADLLATGVESATFNATSAGIKLMLGTYFASAITRSLGGDDESREEEERKEERTIAKPFGIPITQTEMTNFVKDMMPFYLGAVGDDFAVQGMNEAIFYLMSEDGQKRSEFKDYLKGPHQFGGAGGAMVDFFGVYAQPIDKLFALGKTGALVAEYLSDERPEKGRKLTEAEHKSALIMMALQAGALTQLVPADILFAQQRELNRLVRQKRNYEVPKTRAKRRASEKRSTDYYIPK